MSYLIRSESDLNKKITQRMDILQEWMEDDYHLNKPEVVEEHIKTITKFWSFMSEEDRDYIDGCKFAIEEKMSWKK